MRHPATFLVFLARAAGTGIVAPWLSALDDRCAFTIGLLDEIPATVSIVMPEQRAFTMRHALALIDEMRDKFNVAGFVADLPGFCREDIEPDPLGVPRPMRNCFSIKIVTRFRRQGALKIIDICDGKGAVARAHQSFSGRRGRILLDEWRAAGIVCALVVGGLAAGANRIVHPVVCSGGGRNGGQSLDGLDREGFQASAAVRDMIDDFSAHPRLPKLRQMLSHAGDGIAAFLGAEETGDLIGHFDKLVDGIMRHERKPVREDVRDG